jgi:D-beta-D-heptose 7-phosphate kinase/D-beta-D-heptose 1-phosphate adenosyltransferase
MRNLKKIIGKFHKAKVLVIGDLILDEYIWGAVERVSPEAPVPVVWVNKRTYAPGGAANVAGNISSLGAKVCLVGVAGGDRNGEILSAELKKRNIAYRGIFIQPKRHTTLKTRIIAGHQQIVRVDWEHRDSLPKALNNKIIKFVKENIDRFDALIIEDYGKGVINLHLLNELIALAGSHKKIITVDPKEEHFQYYHKVTSITPNRKELENAVRSLKIKDETNSFKVYTERLSTKKDIDSAGHEVLRYLDLESLLVTLGEHGMRLFEKGGRITNIPTIAQEVFDVSGAGDTAIATFTLGLCAGASKLEAAHIANFAAGIVVGKVGTATVTREELLEKIAYSV